MDGYESAKLLNIFDTNPKKEWIMDYGCSFHRELDDGQVMLGNNQTCKVLGIGTIRLRMFNGSEKLLQNVRYVPKLKRNLISLGVLNHSGYTFKSESETLKVFKRSMIVMKGTIKNDLYILVGKTIIGEASPVQSSIDSKVRFWHLRLGHISQKGLMS